MSQLLETIRNLADAVEQATGDCDYPALAGTLNANLITRPNGKPWTEWHIRNYVRDRDTLLHHKLVRVPQPNQPNYIGRRQGHRRIRL